MSLRAITVESSVDKSERVEVTGVHIRNNAVSNTIKSVAGGKSHTGDLLELAGCWVLAHRVHDELRPVICDKKLMPVDSGG